MLGERTSVVGEAILAYSDILNHVEGVVGEGTKAILVSATVCFTKDSGGGVSGGGGGVQKDKSRPIDIKYKNEQIFDPNLFWPPPQFISYLPGHQVTRVTPFDPYITLQITQYCLRS
jgi:hypothetical protein